jgi:hypothetical protein
MLREQKQQAMDGSTCFAQLSISSKTAIASQTQKCTSQQQGSKQAIQQTSQQTSKPASC